MRRLKVNRSKFWIKFGSEDIQGSFATSSSFLLIHDQHERFGTNESRYCVRFGVSHDNIKRFFATSCPSFHQQAFYERRRRTGVGPSPLLTLATPSWAIIHTYQSPSRLSCEAEHGLTAGCSWRIILVSSIFTC